MWCGLVAYINGKRAQIAIVSHTVFMIVYIINEFIFIMNQSFDLLTTPMIFLAINVLIFSSLS